MAARGYVKGAKRNYKRGVRKGVFGKAYTGKRGLYVPKEVASAGIAGSGGSGGG